MPDVDQCVRYAEHALCGNSLEMSRKIFELDDDIKVKIFQNKDPEEINTIINNASSEIKKFIVDKFYNGELRDIVLYPASRNNKEGSDLYHMVNNQQRIDIEVKFGAKTDRNIGKDRFVEFFGSSVFSEALALEIRGGWVKQYIQERDSQKQFERLFSSLNKAIEKFNLNLPRQLEKSKQEIMEQEIMQSVGGVDNRVNLFKFNITNDGCKYIKSFPTSEGTWTILKVHYLDDTVKRVNVFVYNETTNVQIKFVLNWKNNYDIPGIGKVQAKLGFGSFNWNVWVKEGPVDQSS